MNRILTVPLSLMLAVVLLGRPTHAQEPPGQSPRAEPTPKPQAREETGQPVNVRLDVTITDQQTTGQPVVKTITMLVADNSPGQLRTVGSAYTASGAYPIVLNVDARPRLVDDKILLRMTIEYKPTAPDPKPGAVVTTLNQSLHVLLARGKPLVVSQSADPNSARTVRLEVKATVLP